MNCKKALELLGFTLGTQCDQNLYCLTKRGKGKKFTRWKNAKRVHLQWCWWFGGGANVGHFTLIFDVFKCFYGVHFSDVEILFLLIFTLFHVWIMGSSPDPCLHLCYSVQCVNSKTFQNCKGNPLGPGCRLGRWKRQENAKRHRKTFKPSRRTSSTYHWSVT